MKRWGKIPTGDISTLTSPSEPRPDRFSLLGIIGGLMVADNLGDVHDEIFLLCDLAGIPRPEGGYIHGWTSSDWANVGLTDEDED